MSVLLFNPARGFLFRLTFCRNRCIPFFVYSLGSWNYSCFFSSFVRLFFCFVSSMFCLCCGVEPYAVVCWLIFFFIFSSKSWWLCLVVGFLCSCIVFTPVFLHSFLLHKTILYYFLVFFFSFLFCCWSPSHFYLYTLLAVTSHILLIIIYLTFFFTSAMFVSLLSIFALSFARSFSCSLALWFSHLRAQYIFVFIYSLVLFLYSLLLMYFFSLCVSGFNLA